MDITTLGRGGSDTSAVAITAVLGAQLCYIFSDVSGVYSADPNKISSAKKLDYIDYKEMANSSKEGAQVLHDRCVELAEKYHIKIWVYTKEREMFEKVYIRASLVAQW